MNRIRTDRFVITVVSFSAIAITIVSIMEHWEFWISPIFLLGAAGLWIMHITQSLENSVREYFYLLYGMLIAFVHGVHESSFFDVSIVAALLLTLFSLMDRMFMMHLILAEYVCILGIQIALALRNQSRVFDGLMIASLALQAAVVLIIYYFCGVTIRHRREVGEQLQKSIMDIQSNDNDMEDFLTNISHELRTPVNVVNGMTTLLLKNRKSDEISAIQAAGLKLSYQIEDIQDYTEIKRGRVILEEDNYMTVSLINDVVALYRSHDKADDLELVIDLDPGVPAVMHGDIRKLHKLFRQLLGNALKFTRQGGVYIKVSAVPRDYGVNLHIEVTDTGIGMTRESIASVSTQMYQANKKRNRSTGGIGLGLPVVYGFVHAMKGFVKIESAKGKGTTVSLSIPQKVIDASPCLSLSSSAKGNIVFHVNPEKYKVPALRDFYRTMAINMASGLRAPLYSAGSLTELQNLLEKIDVTHVFMGQEEFEEAPNYFRKLREKGIVIAVSASKGFMTDQNVIVMPKPLYGFPVIRVVNDGYGLDGDQMEAGEEKPFFDGVRALIVDDEPMNLIVATGLFKDYGMITDTAASGREALDKVANATYDIVFMDHMMPEMDGVEAMKRIRDLAKKKREDIVIVALTANAVSGAKEMFFQEGFDGFIAKPINISDFERVMKRVLPESETGEGGTKA